MSYAAKYKGTNLLVVDDDKAIRSLINTLAASWSYEVVECKSAEEALLQLDRSTFNIVLTDIKMGRMNGIELATSIRQKRPMTAVIIMTGSPSSKTAEQAQDLGAIYYLQKPLTLELLGDTLRIASSWNINKLVSVAAKKFLAEEKNDPEDKNNLLPAIKHELLISLTVSNVMKDLRAFAKNQPTGKNSIMENLKMKFDLV